MILKAVVNKIDFEAMWGQAHACHSLEEGNPGGITLQNPKRA
jgi:hypothetical protein